MIRSTSGCRPIVRISPKARKQSVFGNRSSKQRRRGQQHPAFRDDVVDDRDPLGFESNGLETERIEMFCGWLVRSPRGAPALIFATGFARFTTRNDFRAEPVA